MPPLTRLPALGLRAFSSTTSRAVIIPPESPKYIEIPSYGVPPIKRNIREKGVLPVPKSIEYNKKATAEFIAASAPSGTLAHRISDKGKVDVIDYKPGVSPITGRRGDGPEAGLAPKGESRALQEWRTKVSDSRHKNIREGMFALTEKYTERLAAKAERKKERLAVREEARAKAVREDVRLTLPSVLSVLRSEGKGLPDPNREERLAAMRQRVAEKEAAKKQERKELIQELYFAAQDFIVTEDQLDKAIEDAFGEDSVLEAKRPKMLTSHEMLMEKVGGGDRAFHSFGTMVKEVDQRVLSALAGKLTPKKPSAQYGL